MNVESKLLSKMKNNEEEPNRNEKIEIVGSASEYKNAGERNFDKWEV